jgi:hypothetical protein
MFPKKLYEKASRRGSCQADEKRPNAGKIDERLTAGGKSLIVFAEAPQNTRRSAHGEQTSPENANLGS